VAGCSSKDSPASKEETAIKEVFTAFQKALKDRDGDKLWDLLDKDSRADADREATTIQTEYSKADDKEKKKLEEALKVSSTELSALTGKVFLKSSRFFGKYHEVPESKIDKVTIQGEKATLNYIEPDDDKEKFTLVREDGKWKLVVPMPKGKS
jgi:hypothetical protein